MPTSKAGPWRALIAVAACGVALIAVGAAYASLPRVAHDLMLAFGTAFLIASLLGASVDRWFKQELQREAFRAVFGYMLPEELRNELGWIYEQELVCTRFDLRFTLRPTDDLGLVTAAVELSRDLRNVTSRTVQWCPMMSADEWFHQGRPSRVLALNCIQGGEAKGKLQVCREGHGVVGRLSEIAIKPKEQVSVVGEMEETRHTSDAWVLNLIHATADPRVTVDAPDGISFLVIYGFNRQIEKVSAIGRRTWQLPGALLPGQVIQVRWWASGSESSGDAQRAVTGEPTAELRQDGQVGVELDPGEATDSERQE